ncbi:MAG: endolytic transglycosylase MltG [Muribaculaceae bacterium]|nr:endolytic transglycosylase MltG [Muribaculaceae bacterium]
MKKTKIFIFTALLVVIAALACAVAHFYIFDSFHGDSARVNIPVGASVDDVRAEMENALGSSFGNKVYNLWKLQGGTPQASHGSFLVSKGDEAVYAARRIAKGRQTPVVFTFNNIRTINDLAARVATVLEADSASFMAACDTLLGAKGYEPRTYASAFIPDSYEFYWTASPAKIVTVMNDFRDRFWSPQRREKAAALNLTPEQVHTLASIVESESNKTDEYGKIARLYLNRYHAGEKLQSDPTVKFGIGDFGLRRITSAQLSHNSPYNTYMYKGLPPGPIRISSALTMDSVLDAPEHKYKYMCASADFSGYHVFAEDYARHRINAARYHKALNAAGIH